jgi:hypothetical protein
MIMPGRSWVAGIDIAWKTLLHTLAVVKPAEGGGQATSSAATRAKALFYTQVRRKRNLLPADLIEDEPNSALPDSIRRAQAV